jgi:hypothetical protein
MSSRSALLVACGCLLAPGVEANTVTPVEKVTSLLKKLQAQISDEGKKEAAEYDKFACFCKEQADEKQYAIEKSTKKLELLDAKITKLGTDIDGLAEDISELGGKITTLADDMKEAAGKRKETHAEYKVNEKDMADAIDAVKRAIRALQSSKGGMDGKVDVNAAALVQKAYKLAGKALGSATMGQNPADFAYHSNDIIATLESLKDTFIQNQNELNGAEFDSNSAFEKRQLGWSNQKAFAEKEKGTKEDISAKKTEEKSEAEEEKTREDGMKLADEEFRSELSQQCEEKASQWDQRSTVRAGELTALSEAMEALSKGAAEWDANKKLAGLQKKAAVKPVSFLQLRKSANKAAPATGSSSALTVQKTLAFLGEAAQRLNSPVLSMAGLKAKAAEDHFVKVRQLIKDIVAKLEAQASAEATQKEFCDENIAEQVTTRDDSKGTLEDKEAQITSKTSEKAKLGAEVVELAKQIAENEKALNEATELRATEKAANDRTIEKAGIGKENIQEALTLLKEFYEGAEFLQKAIYTPPNAGRDGKTVSDMAPKGFDSEYKGRQQESKGIIGLLQVIMADFERTETTTTDQEKASLEEFEKFSEDNKEDTEKKNEDKEAKEGQITELEDKLVTLEDEKKDAAKALELAEEELKKLHNMCIAGEESYEERVAKRQKEIESLKQAMRILDEWQK